MSERIKFRQIGLYFKDKKIFQDLAEIFQQCFPSQREARIGYLIKMIKKEMKEGHRYIVAKVNGETVGFVSWRVWGEPRHQLVELYHIAVHPDFVGRGAGRILVDGLIKAANLYYQKYDLSGVRKLFVLTHAANLDARAFYESVGFKKTATLPSFFRQDVDEIMLAKDFSEVKDGEK